MPKILAITGKISGVAQNTACKKTAGLFLLY
jgi:hypothetical protein